MVSLSNEEEELVEALASCLGLAVRESPHAEFSDLNKTKTQKLLYLAIDQFDLPVSYCWYLAGSLVESSAASPGAIETSLEEAPSPQSPTPLDDVHETDDTSTEDDSDSDVASSPPDVMSEIAREFEMTTSFEDEREYLDQPDGPEDREGAQPLEHSKPESIPSPEAATADLSEISVPDEVDFPTRKVVDFLKSRLSSYPLGSTDEFLLHFYHHHAPEEYRELYESSLHVRAELRAITQQLRAAADDNGNLEGLSRKIDRLGDHITDLHLRLYEHESLRPTVRSVVRSTDVIEDALLMVENLTESHVRDHHVAALEELQTFFYSGVWKYPALRIAADTAVGPSAGRIRQTRERQFEAFGDELDTMQSDVVETLSEAGLIPSVSDYPGPQDDAANDAITDLFSHYTS